MKNSPKPLKKTISVSLIVGAGLLCSAPLGSAQTWQLATTPEIQWRSVSASADFARLFAVGWNEMYDGNVERATPQPIYISTNSGAAWIQTSSPAGLWQCVASSADGIKVAAATAGENIDFYGRLDGHGHIYTSTNSGATWTQTSAPEGVWMKVVSSADGARLAGIWYSNGYSRFVYTSSDSGATWLPTPAPSNELKDLACSVNGAKLIAAGDLIYASIDGGVTWTPTGAPSNTWTCVASSADGTKLLAGSYYPGFGPGDGMIYISTNSGATWTPNLGSTTWTSWASLACSADASVLVAATSRDWGGAVVTSSNSGTTWRDYFELSSGDYYAFTLASDGHRILTSSQTAFALYSLQFPFSSSPPVWLPQIGLNRKGSDVVASWLVPSTSFNLQQSSKLDGSDWADVATTATLNFTNLHYEVPVSPTNDQSFYRLRQQ